MSRGQPFRTEGHLHPVCDRDVLIERPEAQQILSLIAEQPARIRCYISLLGPRQIGKTTLLHQLRNTLQESPQYKVVLTDLRKLSWESEETSHEAVCLDIAEQTGVALDPHNYQRWHWKIIFGLYLEEVGLELDSLERVIVLMDEVGSLSEEVSRSFFGSIRSIFNRRDDKPGLNKLLFVFAGSSDLYRLALGFNSPLENVCEHVLLGNLPKEGVHRLAANLVNLESQQRDILAKSVFEWTNGHPYLTQKLYALFAESEDYRRSAVRSPSKLVESMVSQVLEREPNLRRIHRVLGEREDLSILAWEIARGKKHEFHMTTTEIMNLFLLGLVSRDSQGYCVIQNKIYRQALARGREFQDWQAEQFEKKVEEWLIKNMELDRDQCHRRWRPKFLEIKEDGVVRKLEIDNFARKFERSPDGKWMKMRVYVCEDKWRTVPKLIGDAEVQDFAEKVKRVRSEEGEFARQNNYELVVEAWFVVSSVNDQFQGATIPALNLARQNGVKLFCAMVPTNRDELPDWNIQEMQEITSGTPT